MISRNLLLVFVISTVACLMLFPLFVFGEQKLTVTLHVDVLSSRVIVFNLNEGIKLNGSFLVNGGNENDIDFYITDSNGSRIVDLGKVSQQATFEFITPHQGAYTLRFDNSFSWFNPKDVTLTYNVEGQTPPPSPINPQNVQLSILAEALIMLTLILLAVIVILSIWFRSRKQTYK